MALTRDEAAIYDRQLRVWGFDAQKRIKGARVLIVKLNALAVEVCKNLALAGVGHLTLVDSSRVMPTDLGANFLLGKGDVGKKRAELVGARLRAFNPNVAIDVQTREAFSEALIKAHDVLVMLDASKPSQLWANQVCRTGSKQQAFFSAQTCGFFACMHEDLGDRFKYLQTVQTQGQEDSTREKEISYPPLQAIADLPWAKVMQRFKARNRPLGQLYLCFQILAELRGDQEGALELPEAAVLARRDQLAKQHGVSSELVPDNPLLALSRSHRRELSAVCAVFGGLLAQEVIKVVSGRDAPYDNVVVYDAQTGPALEISLRP